MTTPICPRGGTEAQRQVWQAAGKSAARELVVTTDEHRAHHEGIYLGPPDHGPVASAAAMAAIYLQPACTRGVWPGDTCYRTDIGCEYRCISGHNATAVWRAVGAGSGAAGSAVWGGIGGALADQSDLAAALESRWPVPDNAGPLGRISATAGGPPLWDGSTWPGGGTSTGLSSDSLLAMLSPHVWYKSTAVEATDGAITQVTDVTGHGYHAAPGAASTRPTLVADQRNGLPVIRTDGVDDYLLAAGFPAIDIANCLVLFVAAPRSNANYQSGFVLGASGSDESWWNSAHRWGQHFGDSSYHYNVVGGNNQMFTALSGSRPIAWSVFTGLASGTTLQGSQNWSRVTAATFIGLTTGYPGLILGAAWDAGAPAQYGALDIGEFAVVPLPRTMSLVSLLVDLLRLKWGA